MHYIIFDLEFNQDFSSLKSSDNKSSRSLFEIIQIGAIKLDLNYNTITTFNRYIRPTIYEKINPFITDLTGITTKQLLSEESFPEVYKAYIEFIDGYDSVFCIWGMSDLKVLFRNVDFYKLNQNILPKLFINIQPHVSEHLGIHPKTLLQLQHAVESLNISKIYQFHNAIYDAYYTAEIFKKINNLSIEPKVYDPSYVVIRPRQRKREIDFDGLLGQFTKMYDREMTEEEQDIIKLAYKMGRTNQFLK